MESGNGLGTAEKKALTQYLVESFRLHAAIRFQGLRAAKEKRTWIDGKTDVPVYQQPGSVCEAIGCPPGGDFDILFKADQLDPTLSEEARTALTATVIDSGLKLTVPTRYEGFVREFLRGQKIAEMKTRVYGSTEPLFHVAHYKTGDVSHYIGEQETGEQVQVRTEFDLNHAALNIMGAYERPARAAGRA